MHVPLFSSSLSVPISSYSRSLLPSSSPPSSPPPSSPPSSPPPSSPPSSSPLPLSPSLLLPLPTVVPQECNKLCETSQGRKRQFARKEETEERGCKWLREREGRRQGKRERDLEVGMSQSGGEDGQGRKRSIVKLIGTRV